MSGSRRSLDELQAHTYLVVVVFGGVNDRDIAGFQRLARGIKTVVQLLGDAQSSGSYPRVGFSWQYSGGRREKAEKGLCEIMISTGRTSSQDYNFEFVLGLRCSGACPSHAIDDCVLPQDSRGSPHR